MQAPPIRLAEVRPKYVICDKGVQLWCGGFQAWRRRRTVRRKVLFDDRLHPRPQTSPRRLVEARCVTRPLHFATFQSGGGLHTLARLVVL